MMVIKTFDEFVNKNYIIFEFLTDYETNYEDLILEKYYDFKYYKKDNRVSLELNKFQTEKLKKINNELDIHINNLNPIEYDLPIESGIKKYKFNIILTEHYISKFIRVEMEDTMNIRGMKNPGIYEGINLIVRNIDNICKRLYEHPLPIGKEIAVIGMSGDYEVLFVINRSYKKLYDIMFITQIKGGVKLSRNKDKNTNKSPMNWKFIKNPPKKGD